MQKLITMILFSVFSFSCTENGPLEVKSNKVIEIGELKISIPAVDTLVKGEGVDSYVAYVISDKMDTFHIEYGKRNIIYDLFDVPPRGLPLKDKETLQKQLGKLPSPEEAIFTN